MLRRKRGKQMADGIYDHTGDKAAAIRDENGRVLRTFSTIDAAQTELFKAWKATKQRQAEQMDDKTARETIARFQPVFAVVSPSTYPQYVKAGRLYA